MDWGSEFDASFIVNDDEAGWKVEELKKFAYIMEYAVDVIPVDEFESVLEDLTLSVSERVETGELEECPSCKKLSSTVEEQFSYVIYAGKMCRMCATSKFNDTCGHGKCKRTR
jgi:hypothetical protein